MRKLPTLMGEGAARRCSSGLWVVASRLCCPSSVRPVDMSPPGDHRQTGHERPEGIAPLRTAIINDIHGNAEALRAVLHAGKEPVLEASGSSIS